MSSFIETVTVNNQDMTLYVSMPDSTGPFPSPEDMQKLDAELARYDKAHEFYTYPGAAHAFMDFTGERYREAAAGVAWPRTLDFFARHLGS